MKCARRDCGRGVIDEQGFCTRCGREPVPSMPEPPAPPEASIGVKSLRTDPWWGLELVEADDPPKSAEEPAGETHVREEHRYCVNPDCQAPVGRSRGAEPGRLTGFCPACRTPFDFSRPAEGPAVAERYTIVRPLGAGGNGTAYLVHDRNLDTDVVLKALTKESIADTARRERDHLVGLRHDSIVRILNYEPQGPYLVLEYVPGAQLSARATDRLEVILAHGMRILQALDYLHARDLLHCDVKPSNIIRFREDSAAGPRDRVRLIDFGSMRTLDDPGPVRSFTEAYAPPRGDRERLRPTAGFDLFCLGTTLKELCRRHLDNPAAPGVDSLRLLLRRATDVREPGRRFISARQFAEQLSGVIRQVVATAPAARKVARVSPLFGAMTEPLHGGLGGPRPLRHWLTAGKPADGALVLAAPFSSPTPTEVAAALPTPVADPDLPGPVGDAEVALARCRGALRSGETDKAEQALTEAELPPGHWLDLWYRGLIALMRKDVAAAAEWFTVVRQALPGELIPRLALGLCAELLADPQLARLHYETVFETAPALGAAGFGLARVYLRDGRRTQAVATAERLAREFRFEREARIAALRLMVAVVPSVRPAAPTSEDVERAQQTMAALKVDAAAEAGLRAEIGYAQSAAGSDRLELSEMVRDVAEQAPTEHDFTALVDLANWLRPTITWRWWRLLLLEW